jgi:hypothetical protein
MYAEGLCCFTYGMATIEGLAEADNGARAAVRDGVVDQEPGVWLSHSLMITHLGCVRNATRHEIL